MSNWIAEIMDTFFNGRPAPRHESPRSLRVRLTCKGCGNSVIVDAVDVTRFECHCGRKFAIKARPCDSAS